MLIFFLGLFILLVIGCAIFSRTFPQYLTSANYSQEKKVFVNPQLLRSVTLSDGATGLFKMLGGESQYKPKIKFPMQKPDWSLFLKDDGINRFIWFGHSTLLMRVNQQTIAVDPVLGPSVSPLVINMRRFQEPAASIDEWPQTDIVLISHNHYDHFEEETLRQLGQQNARFIVPLGLSEYLKPLGIDAKNIEELDWWQTAVVGENRYTLVPALHNSGRSLTDSNKSFWGGYVIQDMNETLYYSGDTAYGPHFAEIAKKFPNINIAFIENGQYDKRWPDDHMFPSLTAQAAFDINPQRIVPVHWGAYAMAFHPWNESVRESIPMMRDKGLTPLTPYQGQVFDINTQTSEWYLDDE